MAIVVPNFVQTTLRAAVAPSDTVLLLASGSGGSFAFDSGDYCYVTVNDGITYEIMKYTSTGTVTADTIPVLRAQDNTTARSFPAGACVSISWNTAQVAAFILQVTI